MIIRQMMKAEGAKKEMLWVQSMNSIRCRAEEIIKTETNLVDNQHDGEFYHLSPEYRIGENYLSQRLSKEHERAGTRRRQQSERHGFFRWADVQQEAHEQVQ